VSALSEANRAIDPPFSHCHVFRLLPYPIATRSSLPFSLSLFLWLTLATIPVQGKKENSTRWVTSRKKGQVDEGNDNFILFYFGKKKKKFDTDTIKKNHLILMG
jgi:hypothetical protein